MFVHYYYVILYMTKINCRIEWKENKVRHILRMQGCIFKEIRFLSSRSQETKGTLNNF